VGAQEQKAKQEPTSVDKQDKGKGQSKAGKKQDQAKKQNAAPQAKGEEQQQKAQQPDRNDEPQHQQPADQQQAKQQEAKQQETKQHQADQQHAKQQQANQHEQANQQQKANQRELANRQQQANQQRQAAHQQRVRLSREGQQQLIAEQQRRVSEYRQHLDQQQLLAQQYAARLQRQNRMANYRFQQDYLARLRQQQLALQGSHNYDNDPYFYTPSSYRYSRGGSYYETNEYGANMLRRAINDGYSEGYRAGQADREDRWASDYRSSYAYQDANYGYDGYYVNQAEYNYYFREGFNRGCQDGYSSFHELGHAVVALRHGLRARSITLFVFGGVAQLEGDPKDARAEFWMAAAGPLVSLSLAGLFCTCATLPLAGPSAAAVARYLALINVILALFNLVRAFPPICSRVTIDGTID
jgi:hypothetical protein